MVALRNGRGGEQRLGVARKLTPAASPTTSDGSEQSPASRPSPAGVGSSLGTSSLRLHSTLLSGVAGYVDAAGFALLLGLFPAHLTGELVGDAIALSSGGRGFRAHLWEFPVFVAAVMLATLVARWFRHHGFRARAGLLALVTLALALFSASDALAWLLHRGHLPLLLRGSFAIAAMGFQSALMRESLTGSCPTTVMTGNLTQVIIDLVDHSIASLTRSRAATGPARARSVAVASALLVFLIGALLGGWLARLYGSISVVIPTAFVASLLLQAWREDFVLPRRRLRQASIRVEQPDSRRPVFPCDMRAANASHPATAFSVANTAHVSVPSQAPRLALAACGSRTGGAARKLEAELDDDSQEEQDRRARRESGTQRILR